jgi:hypothetical protein
MNLVSAVPEGHAENVEAAQIVFAAKWVNRSKEVNMLD